MLEQRDIFLAVLCGPTEKHCAVYELMLMIDVVAEMNAQLWAQYRHYTTMTVAIVRLI